MSETSLSILFERLHWPVPFVKWRAARQIAKLIRSKDERARQRFIIWISKQYLESDCAMCVSIIEGFELSVFFEFEELREAIRKPSLYTDSLLVRMYPDSNLKFESWRYTYSTKMEIPSAHEARLFKGAMGSVIPLIFESSLKRLQEISGLPFLQQWRSQWLDIWRNNEEPYSDSPDYFFKGDRGSVGQFDVRQKAVLMSAYLRVLALAYSEWELPVHIATFKSMLVSAINRGVADFDFSVRPEWSKNLLELMQETDPQTFARKVWSAAKEEAGTGFEPLNIVAVDHSELQILELKIERVITSRKYDKKELQGLPFPDPPWIFLENENGEIDGYLDDKPVKPRGGLQCLTVAIQPAFYGRFSVGFFPDTLKFASPLLTTGRASISIFSDHLGLKDDEGTLSNLLIWQSDWQPVHPAQFDFTSSLTTCRSSSIKRFRSESKVSLPRLVRLRHGKRENAYSDFEISETVFVI